MTHRNIFQTHKSLDYIRSKSKVSQAVNTWVHSGRSKNFNYYFYNDQMCDQFMQKMGAEIYSAYCRLPMAVMKADLWRYCVIYHFGGIYADTDTICKTNPEIFLTNTLTIVAENSTHLCQWVFSAPKGSAILKSVIDLSVERILTIPEIKGEHIIHELTGPGVFTDGIEKYLKENGLPTFEHDRKQYYKYPHEELKVFNYDNFHKNVVQHFYTGTDPDGWCNERNQKLM